MAESLSLMEPTSSSLRTFLVTNRWLLLVGIVLALSLRCLFFFKFRLLSNDSYLYGDLAKNWLQHGILGQTTSSGPEPTYIRLPGYPLFLLLVWAITGVEHYSAVLLVQIVVDVLTCFVITDLARRTVGDRAAKVAFLLAGLCPFFANYASVALTETWAIFLAALAMDFAVAGFDVPGDTRLWIGCGVALAGGILLRPDGGMLLAIFGAYGLYTAFRRRSRQLMIAVLIAGLVALAPLVPWTIRNWRTFHTFQPLAPFSATMPWEFVPHGFQRWVRTWSADYSSVEDVWFKADGEDLGVRDLPPRAYDSPGDLERTQQLFEAYADNGDAMSPEIDRAFDQLARDRIRARPLRYYLVLPFLRAADLWLRPRTEMLPIDPHWWRLSDDDPRQFRWAVLLGAVNLSYVFAGIFALVRRRIDYVCFFLAFFLFRTVFLAWLPNPEPRYMLECYPALLVIASAAFTKSLRIESMP
ncbi:MAG TPA: glycosyltransferase family 39 protein [Terriglobales bacterium]|nr:glycosyltransferase family 39 protein [Terriglobales bacterium]